MTNTRFPRALVAAAVLLFAAVVPAAAGAFGASEPILAAGRVPYLAGAPTPILLLVVGTLMIGLTLGRKAVRSR